MKWMMLACLFMSACVYTHPPARIPACEGYRQAPEPGPRLPTDAERKALIEQSDPGPVPTQKELAEVEPVLRRNLKDPESLKHLQFSQPYKEMLWGEYPERYKFVWRVDFTFRARSGFGGYVLHEGCADYINGKLYGISVLP